MEKKSKVGYTKTGFSKSGFACCGHWKVCEMGKLICHYSTIDPEVKDYCSCYQRHHNGNVTVLDNQETLPMSDYTNENKAEIKEQLSLF